MVVDAAIVGPCHGAQLSAAIRDFHGLDLLRSVVRQPVLQVDPCSFLYLVSSKPLLSTYR